MTGNVKRLVVDRGFGFLTAEGGKEYFFHRSGVLGDFDRLNEGDSVSFEIGQDGGKGPRAERVEKVQLAASADPLPAA